MIGTGLSVSLQVSFKTALKTNRISPSVLFCFVFCIQEVCACVGGWGRGGTLLCARFCLGRRRGHKCLCICICCIDSVIMIVTGMLLDPVIMIVTGMLLTPLL